MSASRKVVIGLVAVLVLVLVAATALVGVLVRRPLPEHGGTVSLEGLDAEVEVLRDERGVAQIYASTDADLMRAQGYVHAQDRFFEMDYRRHATAGRLSELVGQNEAAMGADLVVRTLGWRRVAEQEWEMLGEEARDLYSAYADGVNAYLRSREASELGLEYTVLGLTTTLAPVEPWDPVDSLAWLKAMAWDLRSNFEDELGRAAALRPVGGDLARVQQLYPGYSADVTTPILPDGTDPARRPPVDAPAASAPGQSAETTVAAHPTGETAASGNPTRDDQAPSTTDDPVPPAATAALARSAKALDAVPQLLGTGDGIGSNSFVVSGDHTLSGAPLLANDPHLNLQTPNLWYQVGLHCVELSADCTFDVAGVSFAGLPGVVIGHNADLAWGLTNLGADVTDLTLERLYEDGTYLRDGARLPLEERRETIEVNGGSPRVITVATTAHGPIISEVLTDSAVAGTVPVPEGAPPAGFSGYGVALQWTALLPGRTGEAIFAINRARDAADIAAAAALFEVPSQNIVFATTDGDIGYQAPGKVPVRAQVPDAVVPADGSWPRPGWDSRFDWQGFVDPADMPAAVNPPEGFIVAANQPVAPPGSGPFLTTDWDAGYRAQRIRTLIEEQIAEDRPFDVAGMNAIMLDDVSPFGPALVPALLSVDVDSDFVAEAVDQLRTWSAEGFPTATGSAGAAYFNAVWANLLALTFADDLPTSQTPDGGGRWLRVVTDLLEEPENPWWDDRTTVNVVEGRDEILRQAMVTARQQLTNTLGKDPAGWQWGQLHQFRAEHLVLGGEGVPGPVRRLVNPAPLPVPGGSSVVNATGYDAAARDAGDRVSFTVTSGPSVRLVADLADLDASTWVLSSGTSGHPGSRHYTDQIRSWAEGETYPWPFTREAVEEAEVDTLTLRPE
ncbi:penicillin acylase family protein [Georgenia sp. TF02-10]|uniref:penicillin acylase family protein n=1 Tax=Georgenia sp. TF02-10 TaxID=2917725 RepID=UPI001FA7701D|nr:penicillin acylase family protein [Georgenia sp. TF02-10]UNX55454.1 penicillin acylase family protein [Georgenia sp. TF02-10]